MLSQAWCKVTRTIGSADALLLDAQVVDIRGDLLQEIRDRFLRMWGRGDELESDALGLAADDGLATGWEGGFVLAGVLG